MTLYEIEPLLRDMRRHQVQIDKFRFAYNKVEFEVIVLIERSPYELLFGVIEHNFSFVLKLKKGYQLEKLSDGIFYKLCEILKLKPGKESFTSIEFLKYFAQRIPRYYSGSRVQPHEIAPYKTKDVPEADKIYFCGWKLYNDSNKHARNFEKTKKWLGDEAYNFCIEHNISSCWTDDPKMRKDYHKPNEHYGNIVPN